jgi:hypothetical protein
MRIIFHLNNPLIAQIEQMQLQEYIYFVSIQ